MTRTVSLRCSCSNQRMARGTAALQAEPELPDPQAKLEEARVVATAKEKLLLVHIREMEELYRVLQMRYRELETANRINKEMFLSFVESMARTLEAKDPYTAGHSERVARYSVMLAEDLGFNAEALENIRLAATFHDIGKIGVRGAVLNKASSLSAAEYQQIKNHAVIGAKILEPLAFMENLIPWIRHHHEHYNGKGYPSGLKGEEIPLGARIISLVDSYDAMVSDRPYRRALPTEEALEEIRRGAAIQFDPELVSRWIRIMGKGEADRKAN